MDERLPVEDANAESIFGELSAEGFYEKHGVRHQEEFIRNARGMRLFTQSWQPALAHAGPIKGAVVVLHGYGSDSSWMVQLSAIAIAKRGFRVHALDHEGHGLSDGIRGHVPDMSKVIDDCVLFLARVAAAGLPVFLYGESLGGALALLTHLRAPAHLPLRGAILSGTMVRIAPAFTPPWLVQQALRLARTLIPLWEIVPSKDIPTVSFKEPWKRQLARANPRRNTSQPRVATAAELVRTASELQCRLRDVRIPFLAVHGKDDCVCDPLGVKTLFEQASSIDKTLNIYPNMWHQLIGEPNENVQIVFHDIFKWLDEHCTNG